jgi:uncharacterized protein (TIGR03435 family)
MAMATSAVAQSPAVPPWQTAAGGKMSFEVASVKQDTAPQSPSNTTTNVALGPGDYYSPTGGFFSATNFTLNAYIAFAYKLTGNQLRVLLPQLPKWVTSDRYDIQARAAGNPTKDQMRLMMQSLLADRFRLAVHYETRQLPVFALMLEKPGKMGPQFQAHPSDASCSSVPPSPTGPGAGQASSDTVAGGFPITCGGVQPMQESAPGRVRIGGRNVTMELIAATLPAMPGGGLDRPILDRTGLAGTFDFPLEWTPQQNDSAAGVASQPDDTGRTMLEALKEQLGLKLESQTGPVDVLVVDHIEEPSTN